ncbi:MAG: hypothetical protein U0360_04925 [Dehalococcoidia bacterium]
MLALASTPQQSPVNVFNERGVIGVAARLVRCEGAHRQLVDALLGRTIVVEDVDVARHMLERGLGSVVTRDGTLLRPGGSYYGAKTGEAARQFSLRRELEELPAEREGLARTAEEARAALDAVAGNDAAAKAAVQQSRTTLDGMEGRRRSHREAAEGTRRRIATLSGDMRLVRRALADVGDAQGLGEAIERREALTVELNGVSDRIAEARDRAQAVTAERDAAGEISTAAVAALASAEGAHRSAVARRAEREAAARRAHEQLDAARQRLAAVRQELEDVTLASAAASERLATTSTSRLRLRGDLDPHREALSNAQRDERAAQEQRGAAQSRQLAAERALMEADNALRAALAQLQRVQEQLRDDGFEVDEHDEVRPAAPPEATAPSEGDAEDADTDPEDADVQAAAALAPVRGGTVIDFGTLRAEITQSSAPTSALGPVNVDALDELVRGARTLRFPARARSPTSRLPRPNFRAAIVDLRKLIAERFDETSPPSPGPSPTTSSASSAVAGCA